MDLKKNLKPQSGNKNLAKRGQPKQKMEIKPGKKKNQMEDWSKTWQIKKKSTGKWEQVLESNGIWPLTM